jgi:hypothetical protein
MVLVTVSVLGTVGSVGFGIGNATAASATTPFTPAGYVVALTDVKSHQISLTLKVPRITCRKSDTSTDLNSPSITGSTTGVAFDAAGVLVSMSCAGTVASYSVFGIVDNSHTTSTIPVNAGDVLSIAVIASTTFETASFGDSTSGRGTYVDGTGNTQISAGPLNATRTSFTDKYVMNT